MSIIPNSDLILPIGFLVACAIASLACVVSMYAESVPNITPPQFQKRIDTIAIGFSTLAMILALGLTSEIYILISRNIALSTAG
jgi:uncharacterized membrane protein